MCECVCVCVSMCVFGGEFWGIFSQVIMESGYHDACSS